MRKEFEMSEAQLASLLTACKPVPTIMIQCGMPPSPQQNANDAWRKLGNEMGFDWTTVEPTRKGDRFFTAIPKGVAEGGKLILPSERSKLIEAMRVVDRRLIMFQHMIGASEALRLLELLKEIVAATSKQPTTTKGWNGL